MYVVGVPALSVYQLRALVLKHAEDSALCEGRSFCSSQRRTIHFDTVQVKDLIGYSYLEHSDMMLRSSEALWLAAQVNTEGRDWKPSYLKGLRGVLGLMYRRVGSEQWKNNCSIYKGPFNRRGSSVSLHSQEVSPSQHLIHTQLPLCTLSYEAEVHQMF